MKEYSKNLALTILLIFFLTFFIAMVSAEATTPVRYNYIFSSYSSDGSYAVKSTSDNNIYFFDNGKNAVPWTYNLGRYIGSLAISPNGGYVVVGCDGGQIFLFDRDGNIIWKKPFGNALIKSISFSPDGNYIDASNALNQAFYINGAGISVDRPTSVPAPVIPQAALPSVPEASRPADNIPVTIDSTGIFGYSYLAWGILALIVLVVFWAIFAGAKKKRPATTYSPPPQNGTIYADSTPNGAKIFIDGTYVGVSPVTIPNVWLGVHSLKATLNGYDSNVQRVNINAGQTFLYSPTLRKLAPSPQPIQPRPQSSTSKPILPFKDLIIQLGAKKPQDQEEAQKQLIIHVNTEGKTAIQQIIKELEKQPSGIKREIVNLLYYISKESADGQKVTEELIAALTYSSPEVKWLIIQTLGRLKDKRAVHALEAAASDKDFLVKYWAVVSLKSIQES